MTTIPSTNDDDQLTETERRADIEAENSQMELIAEADNAPEKR